MTVSWHDSSVIGGPNLYDANCDAKVIIGLADMARIWTPDVYIYNAMETVCVKFSCKKISTHFTEIG